MLYSLESVDLSLAETLPALEQTLALAPDKLPTSPMLEYLPGQGLAARGMPFIHQLTSTLEQFRQQEMERHPHRKMSGEEVCLLDEATRGLMARFLGLVTAKLNAARQRGDADQLAEVFAAVFDLENKPICVPRV